VQGPRWRACEKKSGHQLLPRLSHSPHAPACSCFRSSMARRYASRAMVGARSKERKKDAPRLLSISRAENDALRALPAIGAASSLLPLLVSAKTLRHHPPFPTPFSPASPARERASAPPPLLHTTNPRAKHTQAIMQGNAVSGKYAAELVENAKKIVAPGKGILAADESTATIGRRVSWRDWGVCGWCAGGGVCVAGPPRPISSPEEPNRRELDASKGSALPAPCVSSRRLPGRPPLAVAAGRAWLAIRRVWALSDGAEAVMRGAAARNGRHPIAPPLASPPPRGCPSAAPACEEGGVATRAVRGGRAAFVASQGKPTSLALRLGGQLGRAGGTAWPPPPTNSFLSLSLAAAARARPPHPLAFFRARKRKK
jgi:hypothetical protein